MVVHPNVDDRSFNPAVIKTAISANDRVIEHPRIRFRKVASFKDAEAKVQKRALINLKILIGDEAKRHRR